MSDAVNDDDARDLALCKGGDHDAFGRLYDRHAAVVLSVCRGTGVSVVEADDACQETFIRAFRMLPQFEPRNGLGMGRTGVRAWLCSIARHVCSERRRAALRRSRHEGDAMKIAALDQPRPRAMRGDAPPADLAEQLDQLTLALRQLSDDERLAIHLHYLDADPVGAAAAALGISRSGYYKLLGRARDRLASLMAAAAGPPSGASGISGASFRQARI